MAVLYSVELCSIVLRTHFVMRSHPRFSLGCELLMMMMMRDTSFGEFYMRFFPIRCFAYHVHCVVKSSLICPHSVPITLAVLSVLYSDIFTPLSCRRIGTVMHSREDRERLADGSTYFGMAWREYYSSLIFSS